MDDNQAHKEKMEKVKEKMSDAIRKARDKKGLMIVITGHGKGKSTSAFGTVARAVGHGKTAAVAQFIKGQWRCGERDLLSQHGVEFAVMKTGFTWDTQDKASDKAAAEIIWQKAKTFLEDSERHLVVLDEITYMINFEYLSLDEIIAALKQRPEGQHVVITGRDCPAVLCELADTVSEVGNVKHAFDAGIKAQKGIDY